MGFLLFFGTHSLSLRKCTQLQNKHPAPGVSGLSDVEIASILMPNDINDTDNIPSSVSSLVITRSQVVSLVRKAKKGIKHGVDMLRYEHLHALLGTRSEFECDEITFGDNLAILFTKIL